jgi:threonine/homoserine/homoserine lactone efflux protein
LDHDVVMIPLFVGTCLLLAIVPGPGAMIVIRQLMLHGRRSAMFTLLGNEVSLIGWGVASGAGYAGIIASSPAAVTAMRILCAIVLLSLGAQALWAARRFATVATAGSASATRRAAFRAGLAANMTNPKAAVFSLSFLPQFVPDGSPVFPTEVGLAVIWAAVDSGWFCVVIWLVGSNVMALSRPRIRCVLAACSGLMLVGLGAYTIFAEV